MDEAFVLTILKQLEDSARRAQQFTIAKSRFDQLLEYKNLLSLAGQFEALIDPVVHGI